jgi:uncharacterized membrane protein HdeD (DUF308 family)
MSGAGGTSPRAAMHERSESTMFAPVGLLWGIVTLIFGIFIMVYPRLLSYTVGIYLIIMGLWAIIPRLH